MSACPNARWLSFAHKFEARYDTGPSTFDSDGLNTTVGGATRMAEKYRAVTYVRDVCVRCGQTVERRP